MFGGVTALAVALLIYLCHESTLFGALFGALFDEHPLVSACIRRILLAD